MKLRLLIIGKTDKQYLREGIELYTKRLTHYASFIVDTIPDLKNRKKLSFTQQKQKESELILKTTKNTDYLVLLDENGKENSSINFAKFINKHALNATKNITFVIGGPYGFSEEVYRRANEKLSLSKMTFSHQMVRLIFVEQLYRAMTILNNEPYHHP